MSDDDLNHSATSADPDTPHAEGASGGWGSLKGIARILGEESVSPVALRILAGQNKPGGVMCPSCAWAKPAKPHAAEFCENGAKATLWELTRARADASFFAKHSVTELREWSDHDLELSGRLTDPLRYDSEADRYVPVSWDEAFAEIGRELRAIDPEEAVFYSSGHAGLEASYLYALFARAYGHNNLPQSSNMCHETTSVNLQRLIGVPVGTCTLDDFETCDAIFFFGQNTGTNSPRFLHPLKRAVERGCRIVTFNPVRERGLVEFVDPQNPIQMTVGKPTKISEEYLQVRPGGDVAALAGMMRCIFDRDDEVGDIIDRGFIGEHTEGFDAMEAAIRSMDWSDIERQSGLTHAMLSRAADIYMQAKNVIGIYGMGLTQHVGGWLNLGMLVNFLMLRGNIGRSGAGISPVRGHSNVQGQRTVGIAERTASVPLDKLRDLFDIDPPQQDGLNAVHACEAMLAGRVKAMVQLGGNLVRALPDSRRMEAAWPSLRLTVHVATKLNRSQLVPGQVAYILPCLGRTDRDEQDGQPQVVTIEDSMSHIHASIGSAKPPSERCRSELAIVAGMAAATLPSSPKLHWDAWTRNYDLVRDLIAATYPDEFHDFTARMPTPGGFYRGNAARERQWQTETGKARFTTPDTLTALGEEPVDETMTLVTLRSNDQFNTTIYGFSDRLRGLEGSREILLVNRDEMARLGLEEGERVTLVSAVDDGVTREVAGLAVTAYDLPNGCVAGYYPELNPLIPLSYHETKSQTPAYKGSPVRIVPKGA
ncbi:FdhF/YdeP family oxidoreductase [Paracoccus sp. TK19116]|uniref:FdhF/YdeP family oxidoreductase n=1 Tax=Paracoccus albicereus TaxID=2922394 RepID=A0ABT1MMZ2_9RHOB|nr:FdhF/YdeP family oxidoreductase [Paracoccus albicereus]MCQ0969653.1 FdhF/YdeP family oxidoreductase [Paracoccus albicereus]